MIQVGPEFKTLGRNTLDEMSMATPAMANGSLILRVADTLYRLTEPWGAQEAFEKDYLTAAIGSVG